MISHQTFLHQMMDTRLIANRFRAARIASGVSEDGISGALTRRGVNDLKRVEAAESIPTIKMLFSCAKLYDVSTDYLMGLSEVCARDSGDARVMSTAIMRTWERSRERDMAVVSHVQAQVFALRESLSRVVDSLSQAVEALDGFRALNPEFDDMRGSARLQSRIHSMRNTANILTRKLEMFGIEHDGLGEDQA